MTTRTDAARLLIAVRGLARRLALAERADAACCGLSVAQAVTLEALDAEGGVRPTDLGPRLGVAVSTLTRNLDRLQEAGLVERAPDDADGRSQRVQLTPKGRAARARAREQELAFAAAVLGRLPQPRRAAVVAAASDLLRAVQEVTEGCCPGAFEHLMPPLAAGERNR